MQTGVMKPLQNAFQSFGQSSGKVNNFVCLQACGIHAHYSIDLMSSPLPGLWCYWAFAFHRSSELQSRQVCTDSPLLEQDCDSQYGCPIVHLAKSLRCTSDYLTWLSHITLWQVS